MLKLMISRLFILNKKVLKTLFTYIIVFSIVLSFSILLLMIYDNHVGEYDEVDFDYILTCFDEENIRNLQEHSYVEDMYVSRMVDSTIEGEGGIEVAVSLNLVDTWDETGISYMGVGRRIKGKVETEIENGIILDILTARNLHVDAGDFVKIGVGDAYMEYRVMMLVKPDKCFGDNIAVCLDNDYFLNEWYKCYPEKPGYSLLFLEGNNESLLDEYLFEEYIGPGMEGVTLEERREINRSSIIKKEWCVSDAKKEMEYTPATTIAISILGLILIFVFIWRENTVKAGEMKKNIAVLSALGMPEKYVVESIFFSQNIIMIPALGIAGVLVKTVLYDIFVTNYYLSWGLLGTMMLAVAVASILLSLGSGILLCHKFKNQQFYKILTDE